MIDRLLARLHQAELELMDEDVADSIWLAMQIAAAESASRPSSTETQSPRSPDLGAQQENSGNPAAASAETLAASSANSPEDPGALDAEDASPELDAVLPPGAPHGEDEDAERSLEAESSRTELPFQAPATTALQNALAVGRALRPLMRKVPSPTRQVLDEEATVSQIAERDVWIPVLKPERERWLDLELVIEESRSSFIWQDAVGEFQQLVKCQGAFRNVRVWRLKPAESGEPQLWPSQQARQEDLRPRGHRELLHASQRGLILLVSDCTSSLWIQGQIHQWLQKWSQHGPTALIQLVPERLWGSSELGLGAQVQITALGPGVANPKLVLGSLVAWEREGIDWTQTLLLPVVTLEARPLKQWARVVSGVGNAQVPGILFDLKFVEQQAAQARQAQTDPVDVAPAVWVDRFLATASPIAQRLGGMMAAAPVSLPVVHLIQKKLLPGSTPVHVAEVFLSGMVRRTSAENEPDRYDFVGDARKLLNIAMRWDKTREVLDAVSEYIAEKLGKSVKRFDALLLEQQNWDEAEQAEVLPFAHVTLEVLRNLGGEFAIFADEVEVNSRPQPPAPTPAPKPEFPGIPPLETFTFNPPLILLEPEIELPPIERQPVIIATLTLPVLHPFTFQIATLANQNQQWGVTHRPGEAWQLIEPLGSGIELELVAIPAGEFLMGSPKQETGRSDNESPQHRVSVPAFFMGRYPVTQAQWRAVAAMPQVNRSLEADPARFKGDQRPVERVNWHEAVEFCARLSRYTDCEYRLPSEAEWEYACRAGTTTPFQFGEMITTDVANYSGSAYANGPQGSSRGETTPVTEFASANAFGLCDMHGNVYEWCQDPWHKNYQGAPTDGSVWTEGGNDNLRVIRGGAWSNDPRLCRSAFRYFSLPDHRSLFNNVGFRVVCAVRGTP